MTNPNFPAFAKAIRTQFTTMSERELFVVDIDKEVLWLNYLLAFPEGTDPKFRVRTEHDCSCCRNFIKNAGATVTIVNGVKHSVWDVEGLPFPYDVVAAKLSEVVHAAPVVSVFRTKEKEYGAEHTFEMNKETARSVKWNHFVGTVAKKHWTTDVGLQRGLAEQMKGVFERGLKEFTTKTLDEVIELCDQKVLYRGEEHVQKLKGFRELLVAYTKLNSDEARGNFCWENCWNPAAPLRNSVIGTLLQDLSEGKELEYALKSYELKVAPANYKRPKAAITKAMVEAAVGTLRELGLEVAVNRRFATIEDVSVNNVLFVDGAVQGQMKDGLMGMLLGAVEEKAPDLSKAKEVGIEEFMKEVLPKSKKLSVLVKNEVLRNFVSLTAPAEEDSGQLFRWKNDFAWSYDGGVADSLREKVAALGGRVDGVLRFSHTWNYDGQNQSLMDLHVFMPGQKHEKNIGDYYGNGNGRRVGWNCRKDPASGGVQDVDYTQPPGKFVPVENITFPDLKRMPEGNYEFKVHNWSYRQPTRSGFRAEIEFGGQVFQYEHKNPLMNKEWVHLATATLKDGQFTIVHHQPTTTMSVDKWGIKTNQLVPVDTVMLSPNHWDEQTEGNKHWFFMLKGCKNPDETRGIYNEFLNPKLEKHRKVFEVLAEKTKCKPSDKQLSGLGFSSTQRAVLPVVVDNRAYNIKF